jgi:signal transduction histidine kinase
MVAHDIKNPLSSIRLTSQALRLQEEVRNNDRSLKLVDLNITATDNLLFLVDEMLAYSKNPELLLARKQVFDLNALIAKVVSILTVPDNVTISFPKTQSQIHFSLIAMEQILINLLSNAIRYNDKAQGDIAIRFTEGDDFYMLEVGDNGRGIPEIYLDKIFDANFTLKIADRFNQQGSGIGLATVRDLLQLLNSSISATSTEGIGTTFSVLLKK